MQLVLDASVAIKWFLRGGENEESDTERALEILLRVQDGDVTLIQPPHFLAEMAAVLARIKPAECLEDFRNLQEISQDVCIDAGLYRRALRLSVSTGQHLFDTLYHAVALVTPGSLFITSDARYFKGAFSHDRMRLLSELKF
ncbi:MAG: hypothetical protein RLZZ344_793 [Pseudomonadota bacterium]|jgi:predicted nucleic acid-binding protein